ncbi:MAG: adenylate/guanylate cyclase domain-containing protein, partial [Planctomycetaceae bacterium]
SEQQLHADIRFSELIADIISALEGQRRLERQQSGLRQFFSPPVLETLGKDFDTSLLSPRECDVTVLFCDLRGFSHRAEIEADNLTGLLERVSMALEVMTDQILRFGGVTGDFQGDAALGFWAGLLLRKKPRWMPVVPHLPFIANSAAFSQATIIR